MIDPIPIEMESQRCQPSREIKQAILNPPKAECAELIEWLYELEGEWDRQIEVDSANTKLDFLKARAEEPKQKGTLTEL